MKALCLPIYGLGKSMTSGLLESWDVTAPLTPTVAYLETSLCVCEAYIFIFALGDDAEANVEMRVRVWEPWPLGEGCPEPLFIVWWAVLIEDISA